MPEMLPGTARLSPPQKPRAYMGTVARLSGTGPNVYPAELPELLDWASGPSEVDEAQLDDVFKWSRDLDIQRTKVLEMARWARRDFLEGEPKKITIDRMKEIMPADTAESIYGEVEKNWAEYKPLWKQAGVYARGEDFDPAPVLKLNKDDKAMLYQFMWEQAKPQDRTWFGNIWQAISRGTRTMFNNFEDHIVNLADVELGMKPMTETEVLSSPLVNILDMVGTSQTTKDSVVSWVDKKVAGARGGEPETTISLPYISRLRTPEKALKNEIDRYASQVRREIYRQYMSGDPVQSQNALMEGIYGVAGMLPMLAGSAGATAAAGPVGGVAFWTAQIAPDIKYDLIEAGVPEDSATRWAYLAAIPSAAIEMMQIKQMTPAHKETLRRSVIPYFVGLAKRVGGNWLHETGEEGAQYAVENAAKLMAMTANDIDIKDVDLSKIILDGIEEIKRASVSLAILTAAGHTPAGIKGALMAHSEGGLIYSNAKLVGEYGSTPKMRQYGQTIVEMIDRGLPVEGREGLIRRVNEEAVDVLKKVYGRKFDEKGEIKREPLEPEYESGEEALVKAAEKKPAAVAKETTKRAEEAVATTVAETPKIVERAKVKKAAPRETAKARLEAAKAKQEVVAPPPPPPVAAAPEVKPISAAERVAEVARTEPANEWVDKRISKLNRATSGLAIDQQLDETAKALKAGKIGRPELIRIAEAAIDAVGRVQDKDKVKLPKQAARVKAMIETVGKIGAPAVEKVEAPKPVPVEKPKPAPAPAPVAVAKPAPVGVKFKGGVTLDYDSLIGDLQTDLKLARHAEDWDRAAKIEKQIATYEKQRGEAKAKPEPVTVKKVEKPVAPVAVEKPAERPEMVLDKGVARPATSMERLLAQKQGKVLPRAPVPASPPATVAAQGPAVQLPPERASRAIEAGAQLLRKIEEKHGKKGADVSDFEKKHLGGRSVSGMFREAIETGNLAKGISDLTFARKEFNQGYGKKSEAKRAFRKEYVGAIEGMIDLLRAAGEGAKPEQVAVAQEAAEEAEVKARLEETAREREMSPEEWAAHVAEQQVAAQPVVRPGEVAGKDVIAQVHQETEKEMEDLGEKAPGEFKPSVVQRKIYEEKLREQERLVEEGSKAELLADSLAELSPKEQKLALADMDAATREAVLEAVKARKGKAREDIDDFDEPETEETTTTFGSGIPFTPMWNGLMDALHNLASGFEKGHALREKFLQIHEDLRSAMASKGYAQDVAKSMVMSRYQDAFPNEGDKEAFTFWLEDPKKPLPAHLAEIGRQFLDDYAAIQKMWEAMGGGKWPDSQIKQLEGRISDLKKDIDKIKNPVVRADRMQEIIELGKTADMLKGLRYSHRTLNFQVENQLNRMINTGGLKEKLRTTPERVVGRHFPTIQSLIDAGLPVEMDPRISLADAYSHVLHKYMVNEFHESIKANPDMAMPLNYRIEEKLAGDRPFQIVNLETGESMGSAATRSDAEKAIRQMVSEKAGDWEELPGLEPYNRRRIKVGEAKVKVISPNGKVTIETRPKYKYVGQKWLVRPELAQAIRDFTEGYGNTTKAGQLHDRASAVIKAFKFYNFIRMTMNNLPQSFAAAGLRGLIYWKKGFQEALNQSDTYRAMQAMDLFAQPEDMIQEDFLEGMRDQLNAAEMTKSEVGRFFLKNAGMKPGEGVGTFIWRLLKPSDHNTLLNMNRQVTWWLDRAARVGTAMALMKEGKTMAEAVYQTRLFMADYSVMRRSIGKWGGRIFLTPAYKTAMWYRLFPELLRHPVKYWRPLTRIFGMYVVTAAVAAHFGYAWEEYYRYIKKRKPEEGGGEDVIQMYGPFAEPWKVIGRLILGSEDELLRGLWQPIYANLAGLPHAAVSLAWNRDWKGDKVYTEGAPRTQQVSELVRFLGREMMPVTEEIGQWSEDDKTTFGKIVNTLGITVYHRDATKRKWFENRINNRQKEMSAWAKEMAKDDPEHAMDYSKDGGRRLAAYVSRLSEQMLTYERRLERAQSQSEWERQIGQFDQWAWGLAKTDIGKPSIMTRKLMSELNALQGEIEQGEDEPDAKFRERLMQHHMRRSFAAGFLTEVQKANLYDRK